MPIRVSSSKQPTPPAQHAKSAGEALPFGLPAPPAGTAQLPAGISLCMIVRNEERFIGQCLESVRDFVDEICIVDTGSSDRTIEIAEQFGARIERHEWRHDFSWARNTAIDMATKRWILVLDADEIVRPESHEGLRQLRGAPAHLTGLWVRCFNIVDDYKGTGASSHALARVFPNNERIRYCSPIHEYVTIDGRDTGIDAKHSTISIDHYGYLKAIVAERKKAERNLEIIRAAVAEHPEDPFHWYNLGTTALIEKHVDEGIAALEKMYELVGGAARGFVPSALAFLADAYTDYRGDGQRGEFFARESLRRSPNFSNARFSLGRALAKQGRYDDAIATFEAAIADGKHNAQQFLVDDEVSIWKAHSEIGAAYGRKADSASALRWFELGLRNRPGVQPLMLNRARALESLERWDDAEAQFRDVWTGFTDDSSASELVNFLLRREKYAETMDIVPAMVPRVSPRCAALLLVTCAVVAERCGRAAEGPGYVQRALELAPGAGPVLDAAERYYGERGATSALEAVRRGELTAPLEAVDDYARRSSRWLVEGDFARALEIAQEGRGRFGDHPGLTYDAAAATVQLGDREGALALLASVTVEDPETHAKASFLRSVILTDLGRTAEALEAIDAVLAQSPAHPDATLQRVKLLGALGRNGEIEPTLRGAIAGGDDRIAAELAGLLMSAGRFEEARSVADVALAGR